MYNIQTKIQERKLLACLSISLKTPVEENPDLEHNVLMNSNSFDRRLMSFRSLFMIFTIWLLILKNKLNRKSYMKGLMNAFLSLYFLPSLSFFWFSARPGSQTLDFLLYTGCIISPKCVLESHDNCIFWNVRVCICISVHYFWLFLFLFRMCVGLQWSLSSRARRRHRRPFKHEQPRRSPSLHVTLKTLFFPAFFFSVSPPL